MDFNEILAQVQTFIAAYAMQVVGAILTLIIGFWVIGRITRVAKKAMSKTIEDEAVRDFLGSLVSIGLKVLLLLSVASMFGIEVTSFVAIFSAMAFAVGLALQGNLANFASGVLILIFRFFRVGDFIEAGGHAGTVKDIHIFHTVLVALDNRLIIIPNGQVTGGAIQNYTVQGIRRHDLTVGIGYDDDIDKARNIIEEVVKGLPNIELDAGYDIFVKELADSSVNFAVRFMAKNEHFWPAYKVFFERIKKEFDANDIGIPFPQMDIHLDKLN
ncbi:mechanosensitive ion channel family protein [Phaeodactylibacter luteus]|uniref:Mechanosensitive ion channel n=1 Tax=Phaeodactylibacter luteus TaxID=1564516 RepID=A0A5C6RLP7_9BACT|nr:mechanosensitive ion channel domain-containing protein [Phaeodactylibacter luteus]TXB63157.1 mechanosensitive ion channel [Phaeodactylibacter luteus]